MINIQNSQKERNVVIYARVSTEHEAQLSALENQKEWYKPFLENHTEWHLIKEYVDEGITGTSVEKRKEFMKMLDDAKSGKFDLILTREVSRFARNTVDTLQYTRMLKGIGVEVFFINDNIKTFDGDGELRLTIMATLAQDESRKTSMRVKSGQKVSMQNGVLYGNGNILGYNRVGKELVINKEQAKTVRMIYGWYLDGYGLRKIKFELERLGRQTSTGKANWHESTIGHIIRNPFYCGIIKYNKQYVPDFLEQKKINNYGNVEQIIVKGSHEPIISEEEYNYAMAIMASKRRELKNNIPDQHRMTVGERPPINVWTKLLECECGHKFHRKVWHRKEGYTQYAYQCYGQIRTGTIKTRTNKGLPIDGICEVQMIPEWKLDLMVQYIFETLITNQKAIIDLAMEILSRHIESENEDDENSLLVRNNLSEIEKLERRLENLIEMRADGEINGQHFAKSKSKIEDKIAVLKNEISEVETNEELESVDYEEKLKFLRYTLERITKIDLDSKIPEEVIDAFIKKIVVHKDYFEWHLRFDPEPTKVNVNGKRKQNAKVSKLCDMQHRQLYAIVGNKSILLIDNIIKRSYAKEFLKTHKYEYRVYRWSDANIRVFF